MTDKASAPKDDTLESKVEDLRLKYIKSEEDVQGMRRDTVARLEAALTTTREFMNGKDQYFTALLQLQKRRIDELTAEVASLKLAAKAAASRPDNVVQPVVAAALAPIPEQAAPAPAAAPSS